MTILLVEDDNGHAILVERNLRRSGVSNTIVRARDGQEALDFLFRRGAFVARSSRLPLLILLDIKLPKVDGIEILRQIRSSSELSRQPVIMLTTTDDPREVERCYELGCNAYITKPVDYEKFVATIRNLNLFLSVVSVPVEKVEEMTDDGE